MELADMATVAFIVSGVTYQGVKYWRSDKRVRLKREMPISLCAARRGAPRRLHACHSDRVRPPRCLVRKFPEKEKWSAGRIK